MINCIVIDDEEFAIEVMKVHISKCPYLKLVHSTLDALEGLNMINEGNIQLAFMDIDMPDLSGLQLAEAVKGKCKVILATAFSDYALQGFNVDVIDYLVKPIPLNRFLQAAEKAKSGIEHANNNLQTETDNFVMIRGDVKGKYTKVEFADIDYIEGSGNYVTFFCGNKKIISLLNLKDLEAKLGTVKFMRVHKSFIVSIPKISRVEADSIFIKDNTRIQIPIGQIYKHAFLERIRQQLIG